MPARQTALGRLIQERREALGYSRPRIGEAVGISPGTLEGWELGRVSKPPFQDVLRVAHYLRIPLEELAGAAFEDGAPPDRAPETGTGRTERKRGRKPGPRLEDEARDALERAYKLYRWTDQEAADSLGVALDEVQAWRAGTARMGFAEFAAVKALVALHANVGRITGPVASRASRT